MENKNSNAARHPAPATRGKPRGAMPPTLRVPSGTRPEPIAPLAPLDHGDHRVGSNGPAMSQVIAHTFTALVNRAEHGEDVSRKLAVCWMAGSGIRKDFNAVAPAPEATRGIAARCWTVMMVGIIALDRARLEATAAPEAASSRIAWFSRVDMARRVAAFDDRFGPALGEGDDSTMTDDELWALSLEQLAEGDEISEDFNLTADLMSHSHGVQVVDEARLAAYEAGECGEGFDPWDGAKGAATRVHSMATESDLLSDGCMAVTFGGRCALVAKGISRADANRDEVGPYSWMKSTEWGDEEMGYQGMGDSTEDLDPRRLIDEGAVHVAQTYIEAALIKGALGDERVERSVRYRQEFEAALACQGDHDSLVKAYKKVWVRYRSAQLRIGLALDALADAPGRLRRAYNAERNDSEERSRIIRENRKIRVSLADHGLWSHVHLSRAQWDTVEAVFAARSGLDGRLADGRPEIARHRANTATVQALSGLPARPLRRAAGRPVVTRVGKQVNHRVFGPGEVVAERGDGAMLRVSFAIGTKVVSTDPAFWV